MAKNKNKQRNHQKRKQEKALRHKRRKPAKVSRTKRQEIMTYATLKKIKSWEASENYPKWFVQVLNYFVSDYDEGTWSPMYPSLYDGVQPPLQKVVDNVVSTYFSEEAGTFINATGVVAGAWCAAESHIHYAIYHAALNYLKDREVEDTIWDPHSGHLWEFLKGIEATFQEKLSE